MNRTDSQIPARNSYPEAEPRRAARREEWVFEAMRHLFAVATAWKRG